MRGIQHAAGRCGRIKGKHIGEDNRGMRFQQAWSLRESRRIILRIAGHDDQIVILGVQTGQKHTCGRVHGTQCGFGVIGQTIEQFANQRDALRGRIDGRKLACIVKTIDQLHRLHHGTGADGDHRRGVQHPHQHAQQFGLRRGSLGNAGFLGRGSDRIEFGRLA